MKAEFDLEKIREIYQEKRHRLPQNLVDKLLLRHAALSANKLFLAEWVELNRLNSSENEDEYSKKKKVFQSKWYILHPSGLHDLNRLPSLHVNLVDGWVSEGKITVEIDLNGPKRRILSEVESLVSAWHKEFSERLEDHHNMMHKKDSFRASSRNQRLPGNIKDDHFLYIDVWKAKKSGLSWSQVTKQLKLQDTQTARNHCKTAKRLIKGGIPGLPPFPED